MCVHTLCETFPKQNETKRSIRSRKHAHIWSVEFSVFRCLFILSIVAGSAQRSPSTCTHIHTYMHTRIYTHGWTYVHAFSLGHTLIILIVSGQCAQLFYCKKWNYSNNQDKRAWTNQLIRRLCNNVVTEMTIVRQRPLLVSRVRASERAFTINKENPRLR